MLSTIKETTNHSRIIKELPKFKEGDLIIAHAPGNEFLVGKTVTEFAKNQNLTPLSGLIQLMNITRLKALLFYKNIDYQIVEKIIFSEKALIASNSSSPPDNIKIIKHERATRTFVKFLEMTGQNKAYPIEKAIRKITSVPAEKFNIKDRGQIQEGYQADLTLVLNNKIRDVIVNGEIAVRNEKLEDDSSGQVITRT